MNIMFILQYLVTTVDNLIKSSLCMIKTNPIVSVRQVKDGGWMEKKSPKYSSRSNYH